MDVRTCIYSFLGYVSTRKEEPGIESLLHVLATCASNSYTSLTSSICTLVGDGTLRSHVLWSPHWGTFPDVPNLGGSTVTCQQGAVTVHIHVHVCIHGHV